MSTRNSLSAVLALVAGMLMTVNAQAQDRQPSVPPTAPAPEVRPEGSPPADETTNRERRQVSGQNRLIPGGEPENADKQPLTAEDLQTWQQIGELHRRFVHRRLTGTSAKAPPSRTDDNQRRLTALWERRAEIERQLIATSAFATPPVSIANGPAPRRDLDLDPDPLNATNQGVPAAAVDRDQNTARSILQEDRSPAPDPATLNNRGEDLATSDDPVRRIADDRAGRGAANASAGRLWQEFIEVHQQILAAEVALVQQASQPNDANRGSDAGNQARPAQK